jgi:hypothetical protein
VQAKVAAAMARRGAAGTDGLRQFFAEADVDRSGFLDVRQPPPPP